MRSWSLNPRILFCCLVPVIRFLSIDLLVHCLRIKQMRNEEKPCQMLVVLAFGKNPKTGCGFAVRNDAIG